MEREINQTVEGKAPRLAFVFKSVDREWPRWAASVPGLSTRWFWNIDEAVFAAADFNAKANGTNRQDEIARLQIIRK